MRSGRGAERSGEERRWGADRERLGRKKKCLQLYSIGIYIYYFSVLCV